MQNIKPTIKENSIWQPFKEIIQNKGITLIALIITIIVMLVLVGVTISIALDGGLFTKAEEAAEKTQIEAEKEELLSAVLSAVGADAEVDISYLDKHLPKGWKGTGGIYTSPKGNKYKVNPDGTIEEVGNVSGGENKPTAFTWESLNLKVDTSAEYKGYIETLDMQGVISFTSDGMVRISSGGSFIEVDAKDEKNIDKQTRNLKIAIELEEGKSTFVILTMNENKTDINFEIVGLETVHCVKQGKTIYTNEEVVKALGITNYVGTYNDMWVKIGEENGKIKLLSQRNVTEYTLGAEDPNAIGENELQKAIWSYKNVENTLNKVAQESTGITNARSVKIEDIYDIIGEENVDKGTEYGTVYNYYYNAEKQTVYSKYKTGENSWSEPNNTWDSSQIFVNNNGDEVVIDSEGDEVTLTITDYFYTLSDKQKKDLKDLNLGQTFFYANSYVGCSSMNAYFGIRLSHSAAGEFLGGGNWIIYSDNTAASQIFGVRAVILVPGL